MLEVYIYDSKLRRGIKRESPRDLYITCIIYAIPIKTSFELLNSFVGNVNIYDTRRLSVQLQQEPMFGRFRHPRHLQELTEPGAGHNLENIYCGHQGASLKEE